jgi:hypothetical protein
LQKVKSQLKPCLLHDITVLAVNFEMRICKGTRITSVFGRYRGCYVYFSAILACNTRMRCRVTFPVSLQTTYRNRSSFLFFHIWVLRFYKF